MGMANWAAEIRIRAERKMGEMLKAQEKNKGGRPESTGNTVLPVNEAPKLSEVGITKMQSSRAQA